MDVALQCLSHNQRGVIRDDACDGRPLVTTQGMMSHTGCGVGGNCYSCRAPTTYKCFAQMLHYRLQPLLETKHHMKEFVFDEALVLTIALVPSGKSIEWNFWFASLDVTNDLDRGEHDQSLQTVREQQTADWNLQSCSEMSVKSGWVACWQPQGHNYNTLSWNIICSKLRDFFMQTGRF